MGISGESPLIRAESAGFGSGVPEAHPQTQTNYGSQMVSSDDGVTPWYRYIDELTRSR